MSTTAEPFGAERSAGTAAGAPSAQRREPPPAPAASGVPLPGPPPLRPRRPEIFFRAPDLAGEPAAAVQGDGDGDQTTLAAGSGGRVNARLSVPDASHIGVRALWAAMRLQGVRVDELASKAGVSVSALENWHSGFAQPSLAALDRALAAVGLQLTVEPRSRGG